MLASHNNINFRELYKNFIFSEWTSEWNPGLEDILNRCSKHTALGHVDNNGLHGMQCLQYYLTHTAGRTFIQQAKSNAVSQAGEMVVLSFLGNAYGSLHEVFLHPMSLYLRLATKHTGTSAPKLSDTLEAFPGVSADCCSPH